MKDNLRLKSVFIVFKFSTIISVHLNDHVHSIPMVYCKTTSPVFYLMTIINLKICYIVTSYNCHFIISVGNVKQR